jgi:tetratricopeptide (TPR) repeat protein
VSQKPGPFNLGQSMNEALALHRQGRLRDAEKIYTRVLKAAPDHFDALNLLGTIKAQLGRIGEAHRLLSAAVKLNPRAPQGWANLGQVLHALKQDQDALGCFDKALALAPDDIGVLTNRANALLSLGRTEEALAALREILARVPQHPEARLNSGIAHAALGALDEAVAEFDHALTLVPGHPAAHFNRGVALYDLGRYADAVAAHDSALAVAPDHAGALLNRGRALAALNRFDDAIASYGKAHALRKDDADAHFMESLALLTLGDYRRGFDKYEWRWRRSGMAEQKSRGRPLWLGDYPLARKTVLLHAEQGLGDTIQFARYVPMLAANGAKVVLEVQPELTALMARLEGAATVIARGAAAPPFDVHCPLGSLPLAFKTEPATVPADIPYLSADDAHLAKWSARIGTLARPRIAIAWAGNPSHLNDRNRSIAFAKFAPLLSIPARFVSIQRDVRGDDATALAGESRVTNVGAELENFSDTAAVIALCDLVISVDTAVAHLAGAMGKPLHLLLPFGADFRWLRERADSPWYPGARLYRQRAFNEWGRAVDALRQELLRLSDRRIAGCDTPDAPLERRKSA